jgi:hypothetical protein
MVLIFAELFFRAHQRLISIRDAMQEALGRRIDHLSRGSMGVLR